MEKDVKTKKLNFARQVDLEGSERSPRGSFKHLGTGSRASGAGILSGAWKKSRSAQDSGRKGSRNSLFCVNLIDQMATRDLTFL